MLVKQNRLLSSSSSVRVLRRIKVVWWSCFVSVLLYSIIPMVITGFSLDIGVDSYSGGWSLAVFFLALFFSFLAVSLPFSLLGRRYVLLRQSLHSMVLSSALLRLGMSEVAVIFGIAVYFSTSTFEMFIPFPLISVLGLLLLKNEENFYRSVLETAQTKPNS